MVLRALDGTYAPGGRFFTSLAAASQPRFGGPTKPLNVCILVSLLATSFLAHFNAPTMYNQLAAPEDGSPKLRRFNRVVAGGFGRANPTPDPDPDPNPNPEPRTRTRTRTLPLIRILPLTLTKVASGWPRSSAR